MGCFYALSFTGNITESYFRVIFKIIEVIRLNFVELYSQLFFPPDLFKGGNHSAVLLNITLQICDVVLFINYWLLGLMKPNSQLLKQL